VLDTIQRAALAANLADGKKATDITLLDVRGLCNFTDVFLIVSGNNRIQLNAICESVSVGFKQRGMRGPTVDGVRGSNWLVLDFGDFVLHAMNSEARSFYRLEKLWGDAKEVDWAETLAELPETALSVS